jgi:dimethylglycine dehydrogenase
MKSQTNVIVIGGGIAGCSALYHLTQEGITDCILLERDELTSGTTWHSAAQVTNFGANQTMLGLKTHSINLYKELSEDPEYPINYHHGTCGIRIAGTDAHMDGYHHFVSQAKGMGVPFEVIDPAECKRRHPLMNVDDIKGGLWDPYDGDIDPAQLCQALARRARKAGAEVYRNTPVIRIQQQKDDSWLVETPKGVIRAEKIVNAGGYRCNEVGAMMGAILPVASMEHQYMLTEAMPEIQALDFRVPLLRCPISDFYQRQEKDGLLIGFYEQDCKTWGLDGIDPGFTNALCPDDLDRVVDVMEGAIRRLPALATAGIHTIINGPITYTHDGAPLVGRIPGLRNAYCITGLRAGVGEGGGHGWLLAQIIAHGEACYDTWCIDPRRFTPEVTVETTALKAIEDYQNEFRFHMPHEHRPAGRPLRITPLYDRLAGLGAHYAPVNGWERAEFYASDLSFKPDLSFSYGNLHDVVAAEVKAVQSSVGIMEVNGFNRFEIAGKNVHRWLDGIMCSNVSRKPGKVGLAYYLNEHGNVKGEATLANLENGNIWYGSAAASEIHDMDWLQDRLPAGGSITVTSLTDSHDILMVAGPKSRELLQSVAPRTNWSDFRWLTVQNVFIGHIPAVAMAVSFSGELAWELHIASSQVRAAFDLIWATGGDFGLKPFGLLATDSMRLEKGYLHWKADLITEFNPIETGLTRFVSTKKDFAGKPALNKMIASGPRRVLTMFEVDDDKAAPHPGDSVMDGDTVVGTVTSSGYGHRVGKTLAIAFVDPAYSKLDTAVQFEYLGRTADGRAVEMCQYDPDNTLVRQ